jgi:ribosomal protein S18 acetylase RimI-like enzyme
MTREERNTKMPSGSDDRPAMSIGDKNIIVEDVHDHELITKLLRPRWGETLLMMGKVWRLGDYQVKIARDNKNEILGMITYAIDRARLFVFSVDNFSSIKGVGNLLMEVVKKAAQREDAKTMRVLMSNDNTPSLRYFQMRGFKIVAFYPGAIAMYRSLIPTVQSIGVDGIPVRDAIELEIDI